MVNVERRWLRISEISRVRDGIQNTNMKDTTFYRINQLNSSVFIKCIISVLTYSMTGASESFLTAVLK